MAEGEDGWAGVFQRGHVLFDEESAAFGLADENGPPLVQELPERGPVRRDDVQGPAGEVGVLAEFRHQITFEHWRDGGLAVVPVAEHTEQVRHGFDDAGLDAEDVAQNEAARLGFVVWLRGVLLLGAVECVEVESFEMGNDGVREFRENVLEREGKALGVGEHVRRQGFKFAFSRLEDHDQFRVAAGIPLGAEAAFVVVAEGNGILKLDDGKAVALDGLKDAGIAKQAVGVRDGGDPRHLGDETPDDLFAPFRHRVSRFSKRARG